MTANEGNGLRRQAAASLFAVFGAGSAWAVQLWLTYLLGDFPCRAGGSGSVLGFDVALVWYVLSVVAGVVALAGVAVGIAVARSGPADGSSAAAVRWLGRIGVGASLLFLSAIVLTGIAPLIVPCA